MTPVDPGESIARAATRALVPLLALTPALALVHAVAVASQWPSDARAVGWGLAALPWLALPFPVLAAKEARGAGRRGITNAMVFTARVIAVCTAVCAAALAFLASDLAPVLGAVASSAAAAFAWRLERRIDREM